jgi:hypothetical protein
VVDFAKLGWMATRELYKLSQEEPPTRNNIKSILGKAKDLNLDVADDYDPRRYKSISDSSSSSVLKMERKRKAIMDAQVNKKQLALKDMIREASALMDKQQRQAALEDKKPEYLDELMVAPTRAKYPDLVEEFASSSYEPRRYKKGKGKPFVQQSALVNYGQGIRQSKKGGRVLVKGMTPIMEFNDVGDDPYVMRNPVA